MVHLYRMDNTQAGIATTPDDMKYIATREANFGETGLSCHGELYGRIFSGEYPIDYLLTLNHKDNVQ